MLNQSENRKLIQKWRQAKINQIKKFKSIQGGKIINCSGHLSLKNYSNYKSRKQKSKVSEIWSEMIISDENLWNRDSIWSVNKHQIRAKISTQNAKIHKPMRKKINVCK